MISMFLGTVTVFTYSAVVVALGTASDTWHINSEAGDLPTFIAAKAIVDTSSHVELWRGLPRRPPAGEHAVSEKRAFGLFEPTPIRPSIEDALWLRDYCGREWHFDVVNPGVYKLCGAFHADWAVVFTSNEHSAEFAFCSSCGEAKVQTDGHPFVHLDVRDNLLHSYLHQLRAR